MKNLIDIQSLVMFKLTAQNGSISMTARELNYAQSNVSTKIQELEDYLETTLFYRNNRGVTLTPKGEILLKYAEKILNLINETTNIIKDGSSPKGILRIGSMETTAAVYLPALLSKYHKKYPNVNLILKTGTTEKNIEELLQHTIDGAFVAGKVDIPGIIQKKFKEEILVLVTASSSPDIHSAEDIKNKTIIVFPSGCFYRKTLKKLFQDKKISPNKTVECNNLETIINCICSGLGISLLPLSIAKKYIKEGILKCHKIEERYSKIQISFIYRSFNYTPMSLLEFIKMFSFKS